MVYHVYMNSIDTENVWICFWNYTSNVAKMWQLSIDYIFRLLPISNSESQSNWQITNAQHCNSLCAALSGRVGAISFKQWAMEVKSVLVRVMYPVVFVMWDNTCMKEVH